MQARRLTISRGTANGGTGPRLVRERSPEPILPSHCAEPAADLHLVHHRLVALERLALLHEKGALSAEEFAAEKALVMRIPADELVLSPEAALPARGPSLLGRLFNPKLLAAGLVAGLALSAWTQPQELAALIRLAG